MSAQDQKYLDLMTEPLKECAKYRPAFGKEKSEEGVSLTAFRQIFGADPLYSWVGLDSDLMYSAHKAAGGMTSIYRQLGIGCERLLRQAAKDSLSLSEEDVKWSYEYKKEDGKNGVHTLDLLLDHELLNDSDEKERLQSWLVDCGRFLGMPSGRAKQLKGVVMEIRQGYKSADSKRQNADLRFGMRAASEGYLPAIVVVSTQVSETVIRRYRTSHIHVLTGLTNDDAQTSTFAFFEQIVGYDLAGFLRRNSPALRTEFTKVLKGLLSPS